jgi:hypothetical protein
LPVPLLDLASGDPIQWVAVADASRLARNDARPLLLLRASLRYMRDRAALARIHVLTLTVGRGDILSTADNWLPESVCNAVRRDLRWSAAEVEQPIAITDQSEWCRGGVRQRVHALLDADADVTHVIERVYVTTQNDEVPALSGESKRVGSGSCS